MSRHGRYPTPDTVVFERLLPGPIERVWSYLVESEKRARWLAGGPLEPWEGGAVDMRFHHAELSEAVEQPPEGYGPDAAIHTLRGRVLRFEPPRRLSFSWGMGEEASEVDFELTPVGDQVRLELSHRRLAAGERVDVGAGWHTHLAILEDVLEGRAPQGFWTTWNRWAAAYRERLAG